MTIPKIIVQTSYYKQPKYIEDNFKFITGGEWEYCHFKDKEILEFFEKNPLDEFPDPKSIFNSFSAGQHKADFFRYYFLYVKGGVFIDSDAMLQKNIDDIVEKYDFFTVISCCVKESCFNGFIGSTPKNHILYKALKHIYKMDRSTLNSGQPTYFNICNDLYTIVSEHKENCKLYSVQDKTKLFNEAPIPEFRRAQVLNDNNEMLLIHYVDKAIIPSFKEIPDRKPKSPAETKIGVTFAVRKSVNELFSNGINQNTLYFCELLFNIGYDIYIIINDADINGVNMDELKKILYNGKFKFVMQTDVLNLGLDVYITFGYSVHDKYFINTLAYIKTKRVAYFCGNSYIIESERILYDQHKRRDGTEFGYPKKDEKIYDEIWSIPQMANTNINYWKTFYRCKCIEVPFIWSNKAIEYSSMACNKKEEELLYKNRGPEKKLVIFEPNISIMKWCLPSILICENAYRKDDTLIKHLHINNVYKEMNDCKINTFNLDAFNKILKSTNLFQDKRVSIESRYNTLEFMSKHADVVISHQWENPLNYLYFDLAWMGWPIIHNAHLCNDVGYYYEGFDYEMGAEILTDVLKNHDKHFEEYMKKNRAIIDRYLPSNKELQNKYKELINNLF